MLTIPPPFSYMLCMACHKQIQGTLRNNVLTCIQASWMDISASKVSAKYVKI